jgi:hypothetical protein
LILHRLAQDATLGAREEKSKLMPVPYQRTLLSKFIPLEQLLQLFLGADRTAAHSIKGYFGLLHSSVGAFQFGRNLFDQLGPCAMVALVDIGVFLPDFSMLCTKVSRKLSGTTTE